MEFKECNICASKLGSPSLCQSCLSNRDAISKLKERISELEKEIKVDDELLKGRNRLLHAIPECNVHGSECIPHAVEWVNRVRTLCKEING